MNCDAANSGAAAEDAGALENETTGTARKKPRPASRD